MARQRPRRARTIYDHARGDGWILTAYGDRHNISGGHRIEIVLYYTDEQRVEVVKARNTKHHHGTDTVLRQRLDVGAQLGPYEGTSADPVEYDEQPRAVRMQRHATDIYDALGDERGMSPTIAVRAAETFGSRWSEKTDWREWQERVPGVGKGRAGTFAAALL